MVVGLSMPFVHSWWMYETISTTLQLTPSWQMMTGIILTLKPNQQGWPFFPRLWFYANNSLLQNSLNANLLFVFCNYIV